MTPTQFQQKMEKELNEIVFGYLPEKCRGEVGVSFETALMAWAQRWSGRPGREQIKKAILKFTTYKDGDETCKWKFQNIYLEHMVDAIEVCYPAPAVERKVSDDELRKFCHRWSERMRGIPSVDLGMLMELRELVNGEEKSKWCEHLEWKLSKKAQKYRWFFKLDPYEQAVADDWKVCPICSAKRPSDG